MDLRRYGRTLLKSWWVFVISLVLALGVAVLAFWRTPPTYAATLEFYVSTPLPDGENAQSGSTFAKDRVNSYIELLSSEKLASRIISRKNIDATTDEIMNSITATAQVNTVLILTTVKSSSPERAGLIAEGLAETFGPMVDELDNEARKTALVKIRIVSGPTVDPQPVAPDLRLFLVGGLAGGIVIALAIALIRELFDASVRDLGDVRDIVGAPLLGNVPYDPRIKLGPLVGPATASAQAEAFRKVRTNLQFVGAARQVDVVLVTSSLPQEGKSISASNLAVSLAELDQRVLLIDADLRRPRQAEYFDIANGAGLSNVLAGQIGVRDAIQPWGDTMLSVLPSGAIPPNPAELLGSDTMNDLIVALREQYDHIIIDSPPVMPVTDATVLAGMVDGVVLVVRLGKTTRAALGETVGVLGTLDAAPLGFISNESARSRPGREHDVGYYET